MGAALQVMRYVIIFTASPKRFEDTLLYFHNDACERFPDGSVEVFGVAAHDLRDDMSFARCCQVAQGGLSQCSRHGGEAAQSLDRSAAKMGPSPSHDDRPWHWLDLKRPATASIVHFLHLGLEHELEAHEALWERFEQAGIPAVNPYNDAARACDSKYRTYCLLQAAGVSTPETLLVSRFNRDRRTRLQEAVAAWDPCYLQPDQGTEGLNTFYCDARQPAERSRAVAHAAGLEKDFIVRRKAGNLTHAGHNTIVRLNVTHDGAGFLAESGYATRGQDVVSAAHGAVREKLSSVLSEHQHVTDVLCGTAARAVAAVCGRHPPPLVTGVDLAVDVGDGIHPYVLDINPRPVVVGSRLIGRDRLFLGEHFWRGVLRRGGQDHG